MVLMIRRKYTWVRRLLLNLIIQHPYGLSSWDLKKITKLPIETIKYNLKKLVEDEYIVKSGRRYLFPYRYFIKDGVIIMKLVKGFVLFSCPLFKNNCNCTDKEKEDCKYLKILPDILIEQFKKG